MQSARSSTNPSRRRLAVCGLALAAALALAGCSHKGAPADPPTDVKVVPADSSVVITWTMQPNVEYWIFFAPAASISKDTWFEYPSAGALEPATSPAVISGLTNGTTYSFIIDGRYDAGAGGPASPSVSAVPRLAGAIWNPVTPPGTQDLNAAAFGTQFVTVGTGGTIYTTPDGATWSAPVSGVSNTLYAALYGGLYLAAGAQGALVHSTDAATWTALTSGTTNDLYALAANNSGAYVAAGAAGTLLTSADGTTWTAAASSGTATTQPLYGAAFGAGIWIAVGGNGTILTSADGSNWQAAVSNSTATLKSVVYDPTAALYVVVGQSGTLLTSPDAVTWTVQPALGTNDLNVVVHGRQFVAAGNGGAIYTSTDGVNWTAQTSGTAQNLTALAHSLYGYLAAGVAGTALTSN